LTYLEILSNGFIVSGQSKGEHYQFVNKSN
jgi:hypothetical protein